MAGLLDMLRGASPQQNSPQLLPSQPQQPGMRDRLRELGPILMMMDPRSQAAGAAMMQMQQSRENDRRTQANQNQTVQWLTSQGLGQAEAAYLASDPAALRSWYGEWKSGNKPEWEITEIYENGQPAKAMVDKKTGRYNIIGGTRSDVLSPEEEAQKIRIAQAGRSETNVNVGDGAPGLGKLSTDYGYVLDPATGQPKIDPVTGLPQAAPVPGTPAANEAAALAEKANARSGNAMTASDIVTTSAARARDAASKQNFGPAGTSLVGMLPWTDSAEVLRNVDVLKNTAAAENLNAMRQASPTGGALGNVTEKELKLLQDKSGALDPNSPTFLRDLDDYERTLLRTIHGNEDGDRIFEATRQKASGVPEGVSEEDIRFTMQKHGLSREEVLKRIGNAP